MKYARLTKEQFEELQPEFARFLATQSIDKSEWDQIKQSQPHVAEQELDVFSDLVWEGVLDRAEYLEHFSSTHIFLFHCLEAAIHSIVIKTLSPSVDFLTQEGLQWVSREMFSDEVEIQVGSKPFEDDRNMSIFQLIQQGAVLSDGHFYKQLSAVIHS